MPYFVTLENKNGDLWSSVEMFDTYCEAKDWVIEENARDVGEDIGEDLTYHIYEGREC